MQYMLLIYGDGSSWEPLTPEQLRAEDARIQSFVNDPGQQAKQRKVNYALSNSFGFGGTNASLIFVGPP